MFTAVIAARFCNEIISLFVLFFVNPPPPTRRIDLRFIFLTEY